MRKRLRVLHILPSFGCGGAERMAAHLICRLDSSRYAVAAISLFDSVGTDVQAMIEGSATCVWYLGKHLGVDINMFFRIARVMRSFAPDIVHTHLSVLRYVFPALLGRTPPAFVHTVHSIADREVDWFGKMVHRFCFWRGVVPVAIAQEVAESVVRVYGIRLPEVIPNGIPTDVYSRATVEDRQGWREKEGLSANDIVFVCVANFNPQKNHFLLLRAFACGPATDPRAKLILAGDGKLRSELEAQVESLGLRGRVVFLGLRTDIPEVLQASDVFVLSSDWEGTPLAVMEALAAGKPVVATAVGGVPELVDLDKSGILVPRGDQHALAAAMLRLMDDNLRHNMGRYARTVSKSRFGVERMVTGYQNLYERIASSRRPQTWKNSEH